MSDNRQPILGTSDNREIAIDLDRLIASRLLVQANSGGGKSWALRRLLEETHGRVQHLVIDPEGEFHTLRERFDYVLASAKGGDCEASPKTAAVLARRLLELRTSAIIDIYELKAHERILFVKRFLDALVNAPRKLWNPALVVLDESHIFAPEKARAESLGAVIDLMTRGRKRGFCGVLATQRISKLNKDAAAEANNKLIGRSALDIDMKRAAEELGFSGRDQQHQLRHLEPGQFFAFGPAITAMVAQLEVGPVVTTHPEPGQTVLPPTAPSDAIKEALAKLADLPAAAEEEEETIKGLRREVRSLKGQITQHGPTKKDLEAAFQRGNEAGTLLALTKIEGHIGQARVLQTTIGELTRELTITAERLRAEKPIAEPPKTAAAPAVETPDAPDKSEISAPRQRILDALAWFASIGIDQVQRPQLAFLAGASPKNSGYANNLGGLRTTGLISYPGNKAVALTDAGAEVAQAPTHPLTNIEVQESVLHKVTAPQRRILEALIKEFPESMGREDLAAASGQSVTSSGFANNLGFLRGLGVLAYPDRGKVVATCIMFPEQAA